MAVIGAGVVGLTCALRVLTEMPGARVTIISDKLGTDTTTAGAAGLWGPYVSLASLSPRRCLSLGNMSEGKLIHR